jgi:hypothetical protein
MNDFAYINCSSVTIAQKSVRILYKYGITAIAERVSRSVCSCGYVIKVSVHDVEDAKNILINSGIKIKNF